MGSHARIPLEGRIILTDVEDFYQRALRKITGEG